ITTQRLPREEARLATSAADFLIVFTEKYQPVIPAKTFEYLSSRRPIVTILNDRSILANLINNLSAGIVLDSLDDVKKFLIAKIEAKRNHQSLFTSQLNEEKARFYLRETQAALFADILK